MAKNNRCGGCGRRNSNNIGCLNSVGGRWCNDPYYGGPCPDVNGEYDCEERLEERREYRRERRGSVCGMFMTSLPVATLANGIIPLARTMCGCDAFTVNSGMITLREPGTYLATYTVRVPMGTELSTTTTLNLNDAMQTSGIAVIDTGAEATGTVSTTAQAILNVESGDTVTLRSSDPINVAGTAAQPMFTLSLVKLDA